jgi:hypothetical protein
MLHFDAHKFVELMGTLALLGQRLATMQQLAVVAGDLFDERKGSKGQKKGGPADGLVDTVRTELVKLVDDVAALLISLEQSCEGLRLHSAVEKARRTRGQLAPGRLDELPGALRELRERVEDDLGRQMFLYIPPEQARYFDPAPPFGAAVDAVFPDLFTDIAEASRCMGYERWNAAVFHLMRVMEYSLHQLAKLAKVRLKLNPNWGNVITTIISRLNKMPPAKRKKTQARRNKYAEVAVYLDNVRMAWRNPVMHVDRVFLKEDAIRIYDSVRAFVGEMAKLR